MTPKYYVLYFVSFGERATETFATWNEMRTFIRHLLPGVLLDYGEIASRQSLPTRPLLPKS
jgi:hypothetical protein